MAPIFNESREPVARNLYLPAGEWVDFWTDEHIAGGRYVTRMSELDTIPMYVRTGTILPLGPERSFVGDALPDVLTLEVYIGAEGRARIVWDATGAATELHVHQNEHGWQVDILGEHVAIWHVRWHTDTGVREADLGCVATATTIL